MRFRITIAQLVAVMVPIALGLAAIARASAFWEGVVFVLTLMLLFGSVLGVAYRRGGRRAFWLGFAVFGWGFCLVCSEVTFEFRFLGRSPQGYSWNNAEETDHPIQSLTKALVDTIRPAQKFAPKAIGEKVEVQWGGAGSFYTSSILEIKDGKYNIRYDGDPQGSSDEWVGIERIKLPDLDRSYRIGELLLVVILAMGGGFIARGFFATRERERDGEAATPRP